MAMERKQQRDRLAEQLEQGEDLRRVELAENAGGQGGPPTGRAEQSDCRRGTR